MLAGDYALAAAAALRHRAIDPTACSAVTSLSRCG